MRASTPPAGDFAQRLRTLRTEAGLSQEALANAAGVSVRALADMERGRTRGPQRQTVQALAEALNLDDMETASLEKSAAAGRPRAASPSAAADRPRTTKPTATPLSLPRDIQDFTARAPALAQLAATRPQVTVVSGQPGLGKTAFAVHAAHHLAPHYPDGQFALDLHGMTPTPTTPRDALARLLKALGVADIPSTTEDRAALWRSLAGNRLLLLDNAIDEAQVAPLLPGTGLTIVTSRHALAGLESVHRTDLSLLRREEAVELLTRIIGADRVRAEAQAARDLADLCGHLPLAVRIAGQRLASRPHERLAKLATRLKAESRRLDALQAGSLQVRAAFELSYRQLPPASRLLLRRSALAAGGDFSPETAALLAGLPYDETAARAEELTDAGLLQSDPVAERYRFHDLLKLYAAELTESEDTAEALDRTADWMLRRATTAALHFDVDHERTSEGDPDPDSAPTGREEARAWLEAERAQWLAALHRAHETGRHRQVLDAARAMHWFSDLNQHWEQWVEVFLLSSNSARQLGSRQEEAVHLNYLAWAYNLCVHDPRAALPAAVEALAAARECGDGLQQGWALGYMAGGLHRLGRVDEAEERLREATGCLAPQESPQARLAELSLLNALGTLLRQTGRPAEALDVHRRSERICRAGVPGRTADVMAMYHAVARQQIGNDLAALERWYEAEAPLRQALAAFDKAQMPAWSEQARLDLGRVLGATGHPEAREALRTARDALAAMRSPRQAEAAEALAALDGS
ncbi:ATP-binding protein [Streptomyces acidiscabies]|uniref:Helix-turn-helix domain-containing protein n=1 Tax=Streptomyces acidiscabies TaxID=42234 RepID=A0AAP6BE36_9ACTN|nr:helix-turn-helix domain-containing protein [Streptomyces acidiscabies]MBP5939582.1 helix-turn-helix domain-containing protein [Streptomyces sp. LBUM 1476]MBZ3910745.1 helix-turn-helix domain-containing protein [Streptomyces acidiscabies]MDX2963073.1 helix-turn-helix domain-containing protein [Streptomyces acidiscabies]MDX3017381.1 helix-turn-helix domain-containing protein [Streptomyces acidiscabies]MDX3787857.1 helix-turn-helix domain-containing protein [Streptomyces acidiscabies]